MPLLKFNQACSTEVGWDSYTLIYLLLFIFIFQNWSKKFKTSQNRDLYCSLHFLTPLVSPCIPHLTSNHTTCWMWNGFREGWKSIRSLHFLLDLLAAVSSFNHPLLLQSILFTSRTTHFSILVFYFFSSWVFIRPFFLCSFFVLSTSLFCFSPLRFFFFFFPGVILSKTIASIT